MVTPVNYLQNARKNGYALIRFVYMHLNIAQYFRQVYADSFIQVIF